MPATQIPQYLSDPPSLSFARQVAKPFGERALREPEAGQGFEAPQRALQQIVSEGGTQEDLANVIQELLLWLQERERALQEREHALQQQSPPEHVNQYGFPRPGPQSPSPSEATGRHYFVNETNWKEILG